MVHLRGLAPYGAVCPMLIIDPGEPAGRPLPALKFLGSWRAGSMPELRGCFYITVMAYQVATVAKYCTDTFAPHVKP